MERIETIVQWLSVICPPVLAESWDNVGFLFGDSSREIDTVLTCLTISPETVDEAVSIGAGLIIPHHPFPFHAEKRWTQDRYTGSILLKLAENRIAVASPHTAHDSAFWGINRQLADLFSLTEVTPLRTAEIKADATMLAGLPPEQTAQLEPEIGLPLGTGRVGNLPEPIQLGDLAQKVKEVLTAGAVPIVGDPDREIRRLAIGCGAAAEFIPDAVSAGADALLVGEASFHRAMEARGVNLALLLPGHFASERFSASVMAARLERSFPGLTAKWAESEQDPIRFQPLHRGR